MAKKENYYITIKGRKYDRKLIQLVEEFTSGKRDGKISINDAKRLLKIVKDNNTYTDIEKHTIEYIRENYKFTEKSDEWFRSEIRKWAAKKVQEAKKKSDVESIIIDDSEVPEVNFPSSWGEDKIEVVEVTETSTRGWRENSNLSSITSRSKKNKRIVSTLIFLSGLLILLGLVYFFRTLFYRENSEQIVKVESTIVSNSKEKQSDVSTEKVKSTKEIRKKNVRSKKEESEIPKNALTILKPQTGKKLESKSLFSSLVSTEEFSSNPQFREIESNVIRFEKNSIQIHKESRPSLNRLSRWMKQDSSIRVKVIGHTSLEGTEDTNQKVSLLRAQTVRDYIAGNGISKDRFEIIPKGASVPIGDNSKEEGKEMNRRVELRIYN
ncbi:OmpA family protein [Leptospira noguchii str. 1993005606]|uniref:OmpA family protein n=2 Tax=Leptospira noguchii TaxID=28182 RepID=M6Y9Y1_9LEPT|nr:OmpA family protein [Leptospira noguchii]EMN01386.1 OmpA family protein [Leptospira noguchii str. 2007001578]EMO91152.1 OmpA family protein [Leptospira noguchii str. 2001034031]EPE81891.1 OmpA family protein [Leptospira noguchii str. 1993005606]